MKKRFFYIALIFAMYSEARIQLVEFRNESDYEFNPTFCNGTPIQNAFIDQPETCLAVKDGTIWMAFEDAGLSGFHCPQWKFHLWLESDEGFSFFEENRILYAVIFYDGDAEVSVHWDKEGKLHVFGGKGVKHILHPWAKGTLGRGNPYHEVRGAELDPNGIKYFDYHGFVGYSETPALE